MKRVISTVLALMLILALCVPAFAAEEGQVDSYSENGKIIVQNARVGETYTVYQLAVLESYSGSSYSYWVSDTWRPFFETEQAKKFFNVSAAGYLTTTGETMQPENITNMVADAFAYIEANNIEPMASEEAVSTTLEITNLPLGYYLLNTSLGTLCSLSTTVPDAYINDKNSEPTVDKTVLEDSGTAFVGHNDADLFQPITFRIIVNCRKGAANYLLHDTMTNMEMDVDSLRIGINGSPDDANITELDSATYYTFVTNPQCEQGCTFHVVFNELCCDTMKDSTKLYVYYEAALTKDAVIAGEGNPNQAWLTYGAAQQTAVSKTVTYTYQFQMVKTDAAGKYLGGATFSLHNAATGEDTRIPLVKIDDHTYRLATEGETEAVIDMIDGTITTIYGLDGGTTYYLQEEAAPAGYNKLTTRKGVTIGTANLDITPDGNPDIYSGSEGGVQVVNQTGTILPETGGFGTTMFILVGSLLVLGAGILLATKLRMSKFSD